MNEPTRIGDELTVEERDGLCADCGVSLKQTRLTRGLLSALSWRPHRCESCAAQYLVERVEDMKREDELKRETQWKKARTEKLEQLLDALGCPPLFARASLDTFELHGTPDDQATQGQCLAIARRYCEAWPFPENQTLIFAGGPGTGKGHLAWSIARRVCEEHVVSVRVVKLADMIRRLRAAWRRDSERTEENALQEYRAPALLVIDEVSRHAFYGEQIHQHLYDVLDYRIEQMRPTILTTNETDQGIEAILRAALWDRVRGTGGVVDFGTASYRARPRGQEGDA